MREIVRDLVSQNVWTFDEWSRAAPRKSNRPDRDCAAAARARSQRSRHGAGPHPRKNRQFRWLPDSPIRSRLPHSPRPSPSGHASEKPTSFIARQSTRSMTRPFSDPGGSTWLISRIGPMTKSSARQPSGAASAVAFSDDITRRATEIQRAHSDAINRRKSKLDDAIGDTKDDESWR